MRRHGGGAGDPARPGSSYRAWVGALVLGVLTSLVLTVTPVQAGPGGGLGGAGGTPSGYDAVAVELEYDYSPGKVSSEPPPPPLCWWEPWTMAGDPSDPVAVEKYWNEVYLPSNTGHSSAAAVNVGSPLEFSRAIAASLDKATYPNGVTWYKLAWNQDVISGESWAQDLADAGCTEVNQFSYGGPFLVPITFKWFGTGDEPEPQVDPRLLADYAYRVMDLVEPTLEWNPKIGARGNAALVNLPTWLWVDESVAVGGEDATRKVRATAGSVEVLVTATTTGVEITSPAGSRSCTVDEARTTYARGKDEDAACTIAFSRGSYGYDRGFPVDASVAWNASWTSNVTEGDTLPPRTVGETTFIRVAQSQALVTQVD